MTVDGATNKYILHIALYKSPVPWLPALLPCPPNFRTVQSVDLHSFTFVISNVVICRQRWYDVVSIIKVLWTSCNVPNNACECMLRSCLHPDCCKINRKEKYIQCWLYVAEMASALFFLSFHLSTCTPWNEIRNILLMSWFSGAHILQCCFSNAAFLLPEFGVTVFLMEK